VSAPVDIKRFVTGPIETNSYVVSRDGVSTCLVIDPSSGCAELLAHIEREGLRVEAICLTHGHFDHVLGVADITAAHPGAAVWVHPDEKRLLGDPLYNGAVMLGMDFRFDGPTENLVEGPMTVGAFDFTLLHVPGHSPGGCALVFGNNCISGDAVFAGSIGRTDFPGCDGELFLRNIREKLLTLPDDTVIWPGHGGRTTVGREKRLNPFLS
jgi:hydroxyacylglutathione hydrolase